MEEKFLQDPYGYSKPEKTEFLTEALNQLTKNHYRLSDEYKNMIDAMYKRVGNSSSIESVPFLPVPIFKTMMLKSIEDNQVFKVLSSSGTSSQQPSKIVLDRETAVLQTKVLSSVVQNFIGKTRMPMIIVDKKSTIENRSAFNARAAGIIGFSQFGKEHFYLLDEAGEIKLDELKQFLQKHQNEKVFVFGFTFMIWKFFYQKMLEKNVNIDLHGGVVIHGGGWKKLNDIAVSEEIFSSELKKAFNISSVHNYYGFIEQVGSIYISCDKGHLHAPIFSDILIRDEKTLKLLPFNKPGLIQAVSILPKSYPGHSILTEDLGVCLGEDNCECGRLGKYFKVLGRIAKAEVRGCSDTH